MTESNRQFYAGLVAAIIIVGLLAAMIVVLVRELHVPYDVFTQRQQTCTSQGGTYVKLDRQANWTCLRSGSGS